MRLSECLIFLLAWAVFAQGWPSAAPVFQDSLNFTNLSGRTGSRESLVVKGSLCYVGIRDGTNAGIQVLSLPQEGPPQVVGAWLQNPIQYGVRKLCRCDPWLLGVDNVGDLLLFDISNPTSPRLSSTARNCFVNNVVVEGDVIWCSNSKGVALYQFNRAGIIHDLASMELRNELATTTGIAVSGNIAAVTSNQGATAQPPGILLVDYGNILAPTIISRATTNLINNAVWRGDYLFASNSDGNGTIEIYDVGSPSSPQLVSSLTNLTIMSPDGPVFFWPGQLKIIDRYLLACGTRGVKLFDVRRPKQPTQLWELYTGFNWSHVTHSWIYDAIIYSDYLLLANGDSRLLRYVQKPTLITERNPLPPFQSRIVLSALPGVGSAIEWGNDLGTWTSSKIVMSGEPVADLDSSLPLGQPAMFFRIK